MRWLWRPGKARGGVSPRASGEDGCPARADFSPGSPTPEFWHANWTVMNLCHFKPLGLVIYYSSNRKIIQYITLIDFQMLNQLAFL